MADIEMPKSTPCQFDEAWKGKCGRPSDNGWCSEHENLVCCSCGAKATRSCGHAGSLVCGAPLCANCGHSLDHSGKHVTNEVIMKQFQAEEDEEKARVASRTSLVQRMNDKLGIPLNLFELLKDPKGWTLKEGYFLELEHTLWGCFPAVIHSEKRIILTLDPSLLIRVWKMLPPRKSKIRKIVGYVNSEETYYFDKTDSQYDQERREAIPILKEKEFEAMIKDGVCPIDWAPGLIGGSDDKDLFDRTIAEAERRFCKV